MKLLCPALLVILFAGIQVFAQKTSQTPMPPTKPGISTEIPENPVKYSKPIFEERNTTQHIVVNARASEIAEFAATGFRLEIFFRERLLEDKNDEDVNETVAFSIDGQIFPITKKLSDKTKKVGRINIEPIIYTQTFILDLPLDKLSMLSEAKSIFVIWNKANIAITPEGLSILQRFITEEVSKILLSRKISKI